MKKKLALLTIALCTIFGANGQQDQHFSMFTEAPVYLNPAVAGFTPGDLQVFTNYRLQWSTVSDNPYRTISASADWRMFDRGGSYMGAGIIFYNDVAGLANYQTNIVALPINYTLMANKNHYISFGLQPAFYQRGIKNSSINWDSQWDGVAFNQDLSANEILLSQNFSVSRFDVSAGVYWDGIVSERAKLKLGISAQHLTKQRINFTSEDAKLYRKLNVHGQGEFKMENSSVTILPAFAMFFQGPNREYVLGSNYKFVLKEASLATSYFDEVTFSLGTYFRVGDALIVNAIFDMKGFSVGASYDVNVSNLNSATKGIGSMEFFLKYRFQFGTRNLRNNRVH